MRVIQRWSRGQKVRGQGQGHKKIRGQGQPFQGQTLSRPRTGMLETKDTGASVLQKKVFKNFFQAFSKKNFSGDLQKKGLEKNFSGYLQNFND